MSTVINTNLASLFAQNSLTNAQNNLATSVQRLSSGMRINSAKDDAAGLAIAQNMQGQILGTNQSINNLSDATNLLQTADSSLSTIQDMLLKMKQLAVQGYDGSLNATQKADIVTQMQDLNTEINATAQRTQFNGINLLTSGSTIDAVNSDLKTGVSLSTTSVAPQFNSALSLGYYDAVNGSAATKNLGDATNAGSGGAATTFTLSVDQSGQKTAPGTYTLVANGNNLTMTGTINGQAASQTVVIQDITGNSVAGQAVAQQQYLDFTNFGISINTSQTVGAGTTYTGAALASAITAKSTSVSIDGKLGSITNVNLAGTAPGTYRMTYATKDIGTLASIDTTNVASTLSVAAAAANHTYTGVSITDGSGHTATATVVTGSVATQIASITLTGGGSGFSGDASLSIVANWDAGSASAITGIKVGSLTNLTQKNALTLSGTVNGVATTQSVNLSDTAANNTQTVNFGSFGISFDMKSFQYQNADQLGTALAALNSSSGGNPGEIIVGQGNNSNLQFQSGANSSAFIGINTLNVQTGVTGSNAGQSSAMMTLGTAVTGQNATGSATGTLGVMTSNNTIADWQSAFQKAAAAIDTAVDYISTQRATYGSQMNRLSYISSNLTAQSTNLQTSKSSITDTNFAAETATLTKGQIMQQAATAMLAQANQMPNVILSLLK